MAASNKDFMEMIEKDFPNEDWDKVPDAATFPDIYEVEGQQWHDDEVGPKNNRKIVRRIHHFTVNVEYATMQEAEVQVERCKTWPGIVPESIKIVPKKPSDAVWKDFCKDCRQQILKGEKVFPMYLP